MKHMIKIVGLCLASMLVMGMALTATASAAPHWLVCLPFTTGSTATRYETHQCKTAGREGGWEWSELKGTEKVVSNGTLTLTDTKISSLLGGPVTVQCSGTDEGTIGPKNLDVTTGIKVTACNIVSGKEGGCKKLVKNAEPVGLPWQTEVFETEGTLRDKLTEDGKGQPGWDVDCETAIGSLEDTCKTEAKKEGTTLLENKSTPGVEGELLVLATFEKKSGKAECSVGGKEAGEVIGSLANLLANGWGLRVSK